MKRTTLIGIVLIVVMALSGAAFLFVQKRAVDERAAKAAQLQAAKTVQEKAAKEKAAHTLTKDEDLRVAIMEARSAGTVLTGSGWGILSESIDDVVSLARSKPDAIYRSGSKDRTLRQVLSDNAADLAAYQPELSKRLELAVQTLPPPK